MIPDTFLIVPNSRLADMLTPGPLTKGARYHNVAAIEYSFCRNFLNLRKVRWVHVTVQSLNWQTQEWNP